MNESFGEVLEFEVKILNTSNLVAFIVRNDHWSEKSNISTYGGLGGIQIDIICGWMQ